MALADLGDQNRNFMGQEVGVLMLLRIRVLSSQYNWVKGELLLAGPIREYRYFTGDNNRSDISEIPFENNEATLDVLEAGVYGIVTMEVTAVGSNDGRHMSIPVIPLGDHEITSGDLIAGIKEIVMRPLGNCFLSVGVMPRCLLRWR